MIIAETIQVSTSARSTRGISASARTLSRVPSHPYNFSFRNPTTTPSPTQVPIPVNSNFRHKALEIAHPGPDSQRSYSQLQNLHRLETSLSIEQEE